MTVTFAEEKLGADLWKVVFVGTLDAPGTMTVEREFQTWLEGRTGQVIVELSEVDYMSSYGLRMLLSAAKTMRQAGGGLHLAAPNENVYQVIKMVGYDTLFPVYKTIEEAVKSVSATSSDTKPG
jgi:anti-sigma B factor antagonist